MDSANARREEPEKAAYTTSAPSSESPRPKPSKMTRFRHSTYVLLLVLAVLAFIVSATANGGSDIARISISAADKQRFQELLNSVDPKALHDVLHAAEKKYQNGVFREDKTAMELMHEEDAEAATRLVELAKRQAGNNATTTMETSATVAMSTAPGSTSQTSTVQPTTSRASQVPTTSPTSPTPLAPTPTPSANPTTPTAEPTLPPTAQPTTPSSTQPAFSSTAPTTAPSATAAPTPSNSAGQSTNVGSSSTLATQVTTSNTQTTTSARSVTQQTIYTTTLADGAMQTVTQVTVVAGQPDPTGRSSSRTSTAKGSLQTNGASIPNLGMNGLLGAFGMVVVGAL